MRRSSEPGEPSGHRVEEQTSLLEADVRRFFQEHADQYLDMLALLNALRERHAGDSHQAFVDAVDVVIDALYREHLLCIPGLRWAPSDSQPPESTRGWFSENADSIVWNPELQAYAWGTERTHNAGLYILPLLPYKLWRSQISQRSRIRAETVYWLVFLLAILGAYFWYQRTH